MVTLVKEVKQSLVDDEYKRIKPPKRRREEVTGGEKEEKNWNFTTSRGPESGT